ncbi:hypothetical protein B0H19DRAFT_1083334 [Mycena capillaripes]|nr:hypothetical protein B0H19DRAFT_1083334 [Mycena capillaripes]
MAAWWSSQSNGRNIFHKLPEHLASQYKTWKSRQVQRQTMVATRAQRQPNEQCIRSTTHVVHVLPAISVFPASEKPKAMHNDSIPHARISTTPSAERQNEQAFELTPAPMPMQPPRNRSSLVAYPRGPVQRVEAALANFAKLQEGKPKCKLVQGGTIGVNALDIVDR